MANVDLVPIKEACRLWSCDGRTLKRRALAGELLYDIFGKENNRQGKWYIETPTGRHNRLFNNN